MGGRGSDSFDRWLRGSLGQHYGHVLREDVPPDLLALLGAEGAADRPAHGTGDGLAPSGVA